MKIDSPKSKREWDDFLKERESVFTQSFSWGEFKKIYQKVERLEAREEREVVGACQYFREKNPLGDYFYIPFGPISKKEKIREALIKEVFKRALEEKISFIKVEPLEEINLGKISPHRIQPQKTLVSDITSSPDEIIKEFKKGTRYNVRHSRRQGVKIEPSKNVEEFFNLLEKTKERQGFSSYPKSYFENLLNELDCDLLLARYNKRVVAATILLYFGKTVTFLHSASDYERRDLNATALIRFESIERAKEKGYLFYDFWGIDEKKFPGVTKFKKGFGGKEVLYPKGRDIPVKRIPYLVYFLTCKIIKR